MAIITYAEAASFVGDAALSSDLQFMLTVDAITAQISEWCGRDFTYGRFVEQPLGLGELAGPNAFTIAQGVYPYIYVRNWPIVSIEAVSIDPFGLFNSDSVYDPARFSFDPSPRGGNRITWGDGLFYAGNYQRLTYWAGYLDANGYDPDPAPENVLAMPSSLRLGVLKALGAEWDRGSGQAVESERLGDYSYALMTQRMDPSVNPMFLDPSITALLQEHRSYV